MLVMRFLHDLLLCIMYRQLTFIHLSINTSSILPITTTSCRALNLVQARIHVKWISQSFQIYRMQECVEGCTRHQEYFHLQEWRLHKQLMYANSLIIQPSVNILYLDQRAMTHDIQIRDVWTKCNKLLCTSFFLEQRK